MTEMQTTITAAGEKPEGMLCRVRFPQLCLMDEYTGDGRKLLSSGKGVRDLPRTIFAQFAQAPGHDGSLPVGRLDEVTFHDDGNVSGHGWLLDDEWGQKQALYLRTRTQRHNSVDLAEVEYEVEWESDDPMDPGFWNLIGINFTKWNIGATTFVGMPAFPDARGELEEITAALRDSDEELVYDGDFKIRIKGLDFDVVPFGDEVRADGAPLPPWDAFFQPEMDRPEGQKLLVSKDGWVKGHLALWDSCHDGFAGRCLRVPRPTDNYASFNKPGVLTDRGLVETGPICLRGGHAQSAYDDTSNAWADVRVTAGRYGPWVSGVVRPGIDFAQVYAARASRISGHWVGGRLKHISSVNAEGYDVPGSGFAGKIGEDGEILEMVASLPHCADEASMSLNTTVYLPTTTASASWGSVRGSEVSIQAPGVVAEDDSEAEALLIELELEAEDDGEPLE